MGSFCYRAKQGLNDVVEGELEARDQAEALLRLEQMGLVPLSVRPAADARAAIAPAAKPAKSVSGRAVSSEDVLEFVKKLTTLNRAQVELLASLRVLYEQTGNPRFRELILRIYHMTKEGKSFSYALEQFPGVFPPLFVGLIKAGEASGKLAAVLEQISDFMSREEGVRSKVRVALAYPVLLCGLGAVSIFVLLNFVVPKLRPVLEGMGQELPFFTQCILQLSVTLNRYWIVGFVVLAGLAVLVRVLKGWEWVGRAAWKLMNMVPIVRALSLGQELMYFTQALALLLKSGVPALKAFEISAGTVASPVLRRELSAVCLAVASGEGVAVSLRAHTGLPDFMIRMVAVGEESGRLIEVLEEIAASYRRQIDNDLAVVSALIEPVLILVIGLIMGGIVIAILLPTFQITQFIH